MIFYLAILTCFASFSGERLHQELHRRGQGSQEVCRRLLRKAVPAEERAEEVRPHRGRPDLAGSRSGP